MPVTESSAALHDVVVTARRSPGPGIVVLDLAAPELAISARPGQFVMVCPPGGERAATALGIYDADRGVVSIMLVVVGPRTRELATLEPGAALTVLGPLGNGFDIEALGNDVALVAGGVGLASLLFPARALAWIGARPTLYYGARNAAALVDLEVFERAGCTLRLATDDGSRGHHGYVTELLAREGAGHSAIAACGPTPMLRATARVAEKLGLEAQLSLEETFACGVGACWGCVVGLDRASPQAPPFPSPAPGETRDFVHARICKEGPVFRARELRW
jgi:dihydroorotate dehydrogenase electron transfer subunit